MLVTSPLRSVRFVLCWWRIIRGCITSGRCVRQRRSIKKLIAQRVKLLVFFGEVVLRETYFGMDILDSYLRTFCPIELLSYRTVCNASLSFEGGKNLFRNRCCIALVSDHRRVQPTVGHLVWNREHKPNQTPAPLLVCLLEIMLPLLKYVYFDGHKQ